MLINETGMSYGPNRRLRTKNTNTNTHPFRLHFNRYHETVKTKHSEKVFSWKGRDMYGKSKWA